MSGLLPRSLPSLIPYNPGRVLPPLRHFVVGFVVFALAVCAAVQKDLGPNLVVVVGLALVTAPLWAPAFVVPSVLG